MNQAAIDTLWLAIGTGELINIIYHGGSEPGAARMIMPLEMKDGKIRGKCYKTNQVKHFWLDKITLSDGDQTNYTGLHKTPDYDLIEGITTIQDILNHYQAELIRLGWVIDYNTDFIGLYKQYKNGKRYKRAKLLIAAGNSDGTQRPWYHNGRRYKYLSKAAAKFMALAREHSANGANQ
jgi:hypothetical protein